MKLNDKTVLITGASSGIGKAFALRCAQDDCHIILSARSLDKLQKVKKEVEELGASAEVITADVTNVEEIRNLFEKATKDGKVIDLVFNNAGLGYVAPLDELRTEEITSIIDVNVKGMILVSKFTSEVFKRQGYGHLIMSSSLAGLITLPNWSVYVASKWAITGFSDSIRPEFKTYNSRVTTLHPGLVKTEFFDEDNADLDLNKIDDTNSAITADEVADAVYDVVFTDRKKIVMPKLAKNFSFLYKYLPFLVEGRLESMAEDMKLEERKEDEPSFSHIKKVIKE